MYDKQKFEKWLKNSSQSSLIVRACTQASNPRSPEGISYKTEIHALTLIKIQCWHLFEAKYEGITPFTHALNNKGFTLECEPFRELSLAYITGWEKTHPLWVMPEKVIATSSFNELEEETADIQSLLLVLHMAIMFGQVRERLKAAYDERLLNIIIARFGGLFTSNLEYWKERLLSQLTFM